MMNYRDFLQQIIYKIINPMVKAMIKVGITPNTITITGFIINVLVAILVIYSAIYQPNNLSLIGFAGAMVLFAGLFDMMDGRVARVGGMQSSFGALLDSTLDRYSELITLFSLQFYFILHGWIWNGIVTFLAIVGSIMVSYVRARG